MSDGEEFLTDDFGIGEHVTDSIGYDLGNEEEDILLAGGNIADDICTKVSHSKTDGENDKGLQRVSADDGGIITKAEPESAQRYRADHKERFPTERYDGDSLNPPSIPDTLDTVVTKEPAADHPRGRNPNGRGRRPVHRKYHPRESRNDPRSSNYPLPDRKFLNGRRADERDHLRGRSARGYGSRPRSRDSRAAYETEPFENAFLPDGARSSAPRLYPGEPYDNRRDDGRILLDYEPVPRDNFNAFAPPTFVNVPELNPLPVSNNLGRNFEPYPHKPAYLDDAPIFPLDERGMIKDEFYHPPEYASSTQGRLPPVIPPPFKDNILPPLLPDRYPINRDIINDGIKNILPLAEGKKVLINPHFKGPMQTHVFGNFEQNQNHPLVQDKLGLNNQPLSDKELERMAEQFIDGNRRRLERVKAAAEDNDFYEKTKRFIENTSGETRPLPNDIDRDPKKENLTRKQEEFINENRLNLRRRRTSPQRPAHRSPPPLPAQANRRRHSPYKRPRPRSPGSPQPRREPSGEPEERDYRAKLREQAEMRARVLQAKERRRRRDAANLSEKLNQPIEQPQIEEPVPKRTDINRISLDKSNDVPPIDKVPKVPPVSKPEPTVNLPDKPIRPPVEAVKKVEKSTVMEKPSVAVVKPQEKQETLDDMLEDDLLRLSPEDEELLLSDEDDLSFSLSSNSLSKSKSNAPSSNSAKSSDPQSKTTTKENVRPAAQPSKSSSSLKRSSNESGDDLRRKLSKTSDESSNAASLSSSAQRKKISFSSDGNREVAIQKNSVVKPKEQTKESDRSGAKWRASANEQKLDLTAPVAVRAISAVMRTTSETSNRKVIAPKHSKVVVGPKSSAVAAETERSPLKKPNGRVDEKHPSGERSVVVSAAGRRVVIPPRPQRPLVVIENEEDDRRGSHQERVPDKNRSGDSRKTAAVTGLPPGMTEVRLLSLCGPEVERVTMGTAGSAVAVFNSPEACQRFARRFNGRMVAACRLSITVSN